MEDFDLTRGGTAPALLDDQPGVTAFGLAAVLVALLAGLAVLQPLHEVDGAILGALPGAANPPGDGLVGESGPGCAMLMPRVGKPVRVARRGQPTIVASDRTDWSIMAIHASRSGKLYGSLAMG